MKNLDAVVGAIAQRLDAKDKVREAALRSARAVTRASADAVRALHRREDAKRFLADAKRDVDAMRAALRDHGDLWHGGAAEGALAEYVEALGFQSILAGEPLPTPEQAGVTDAAWLLGLGDVVGELRRLALDAVRAGDLPKADGSLLGMERIFDALVRIDAPAALVPLRHKVDVARSLIEKTRGEVAVLAASRDLAAKLERVAGAPGPAAEAKRKGDLDLDIDAVWKP